MVASLSGQSARPQRPKDGPRLPLSPRERAGVRGKAPSDRLRLSHYSRLAAVALAIVLGLCAIPSAYAQVKRAGDAKLAFAQSGTNEFAFDTGVLKGKLRAEGKSKGLSSVVHMPTGMTLDHSMGLFGHYRVFTANKRYGSAAWDWPSEAKLLRNGSVEVRWPAAEDRPFELSALYRWAAPNILDLQTTVKAKADLAKFESFLASYFAAGFTNAGVYARAEGQPRLVRADSSAGVWQAFPRDDAAAAMIQDGRWKYPPSPVEWVIRPSLEQPLGMRCSPANNLTALVLSRSQDAFAVLTPQETEGHRSMYLSLFGKDLKAGETARAQARLIVDVNLFGERPDKLCSTYLPKSR